jgi:hypothetical protein
MLRAKKGCHKLWHIHAVEELDGVDFAVGIFKLEAKRFQHLGFASRKRYLPLWVLLVA